MKRKIVNIDEKKCNGCGLCVNACHEGAIELVDGKARLISDEYCDGLGDCLPECPVGAIKIVERESKDYNEKLVMEKKKEKEKLALKAYLPCGCPGAAARTIERMPRSKKNIDKKEHRENLKNISELRQWPVQLKLINPRAPYLKNADLLVAADCTAYAYANFHEDFIQDHIVVIGCPKLDDIDYYEEKFEEIIKNNDLKSITVVRMEVPCCGGIVNAVKRAMLQSGIIIPYREVTVATNGDII
ncbi:ATP-binding protein [Clostridium luticellarii]|jgi:ferredoxin|uniref:Ferredoxin n=1 Tax=Clostridium luticellarii TaxID=1691940 RepID=A0A2T0BN81_9CLOT|nr:4Fe-4S binding protein [Clostridium luticellarii]MCI1945654.1 4Fe-4S binding protein [Clostridium luticellarii]MCI1967410.1 4Fe-4S binding protein [Clostridium luticellarii]MCI1996288.1 4Fe-4S binding protein [Clostridium luticellarii]MCI2039807.1 4Fe-4S binding protein [Clostridium luticellarii]PRR85326.1 ferredoxin [Clostridium luticellarii]